MNYFFKKSIIFLLLILLLSCSEKKEKISLNFNPQTRGITDDGPGSQSSIYTTLNLSRKGKMVLGIFNFRNDTEKEDVNWMRQGITNALINNMSKAQFLEIISTERLADLMQTAGISEITEIDRSIANKLTEKEKIDILINGDFKKHGNERIIITSRLYNTTQYRYVFSDTVIGHERDDFFLMARKLSEKIREHLQLEKDIDYEKEKPTENLMALKYFSEGLEDESNGLTESAIENYIDAIKLDQTFSKAYFRIVNNLLKDLNQQNLERSKDFIDAALNFRNKLDEKEIFILTGYLKLALNKVREAVVDFEQYVKNYPGEKEGHYILAKIYNINGELNRAISQLNPALELDPNYFEALQLKAEILFRLGDKDNSIKIAEKLIRIYPDNAQSYVFLGRLYRNSGRTADALRQFETAINKEPEYFWPYLNIGIQYFTNKEYSRSLRYFEDAFSRIPRYSEDILFTVLEFLDENYFLLGQYNDALNMLNQVEDEELFSEYPEYAAEIKLLKSEILIEFERTTEAFMNVFNQESSFIFSERYFSLLGDIYLKSSDQEIINSITAIMTKNENSIEYDIFKSFRNIKEKKWLDAINNFMNLAQNTGEIRLSFYLGIVYFRNNQFTKAIEHLKNILGSFNTPDPKFSILKPNIEYYLGMSLKASGEKTEARNIISKLVRVYYKQNAENLNCIKNAQDLLDEF